MVVALRFRAAGGARGSLSRTCRRSPDSGEIPPARSQPAAGGSPGHCGPRRRSAFARGRERAAPAPSGPTQVLHTRGDRPAHSVPRKAVLIRKADRAPWAPLCSGDRSLQERRPGHPSTDITGSCGPICAAAGPSVAFPARIEGPQKTKESCRTLVDPLSLHNVCRKRKGEKVEAGGVLVGG